MSVLWKPVRERLRTNVKMPRISISQQRADWKISIPVIERSAAVENPNQQITKGFKGPKFLTLVQKDQAIYVIQTEITKYIVLIDDT